MVSKKTPKAAKIAALQKKTKAAKTAALQNGLVKVANQYRWCSAPWFERTATPAQVQTIYGFKTDQVKVRDDYEPL